MHIVIVLINVPLHETVRIWIYKFCQDFYKNCSKCKFNPFQLKYMYTSHVKIESVEFYKYKEKRYTFLVCICKHIIRMFEQFFLFFEGNEYLHLLTSQSMYELRVDMTDFEGESRFAKYKLFQVGSRDTKFRLTVGGYSGTAGT